MNLQTPVYVIFYCNVSNFVTVTRSSQWQAFTQNILLRHIRECLMVGRKEEDDEVVTERWLFLLCTVTVEPVNTSVYNLVCA